MRVLREGGGCWGVEAWQKARVEAWGGYWGVEAWPQPAEMSWQRAHLSSDVRDDDGRPVGREVPFDQGEAVCPAHALARAREGVLGVEARVWMDGGQSEGWRADGPGLIMVALLVVDGSVFGMRN